LRQAHCNRQASAHSRKPLTLWASLPTRAALACEVSFSPVPAGKRLIIESISGEVVANLNASIRSGRLSSTTAAWHVPTVLQSSFVNASTYAINSQVLAYFEAGQIPVLRVTTDAINLGFDNEVTLSEHFVDVP
jgi:hypothetical protein